VILNYVTLELAVPQEWVTGNMTGEMIKQSEGMIGVIRLLNINYFAVL
jgi:hypothetical protein